jgi:tetratricopeptide (TPR) repeat protein
MDPQPRGAASPRLFGLGLGLITLLVYLPVRHNGFLQFDDPVYITNNRVVQSGLTWAGLQWALTSLTASNWHPITWLSHMLDCQLFGSEAGAHHLVSVLLHAANGSLLLVLLCRLTHSFWPSAFAAALFAWHPLRVESVAWASERKDVLSAFFFLLTLMAYTRYAENCANQSQRTALTGHLEEELRKEECETGALSSRYYLLALGLYALGLMSKAMLVTTPFVLLLLDYWPLRRFASLRGHENRSIFGKLIWEKWPFFLMAATCSVVTYLAQREEAVVQLIEYPLGLRLVNIVLANGSYLFKTIWPFDLAIIYPFPRYVPWRELTIYSIILVGISWLSWRSRHERPHLLVGWLWFLGTLIPVIGLVQVGSATTADRYTYIPHIGLFLAAGMEARYWFGRWQLAPALPTLTSIAVLAACLVLTTLQLRYWGDPVSLFTHTIEVTGDNPMAEFNLAVSLDERGAKEEALKSYEKALRLNPQLQEAHKALADLLNELGKTNEAIVHYRAALRIRERPETHENLGALLVKLGRIDEAMIHYEAAARLDPHDGRSQYLMAKALLRQGRSDQAVERFHEALRRDPDNLQALVYLARVLAASHDPRIRNGAEATRLAERANMLTGGTQSFMLDTLAMAYAESGRFDEAEQTLRQALERASASGETEVTSAMQDRLKLYHSRQPYRENFELNR